MQPKPFRSARIRRRCEKMLYFTKKNGEIMGFVMENTPKDLRFWGDKLKMEECAFSREHDHQPIDLGPRRIFKMGKGENIEGQGEKTSKVLAHQRQLDGFDLLSMFWYVLMQTACGKGKASCFREN